MAATTELDTVRGFILRQTCATVREVAGAPAATACQAAVRTRPWIDFMSYPARECLQLTALAVDRLVPFLGSADSALFRIGHDLAQEFLTSPLGKIASTLAASDPRRLLGILGTAYRMTVSYGERKVTWTGPTSARIGFRRDFFNGAFHEGVLTYALTFVGAKEPRVRGVALGLLDMDYEASWS